MSLVAGLGDLPKLLALPPFSLSRWQEQRSTQGGLKNAQDTHGPRVRAATTRRPTRNNSMNASTEQ